MKMNRGMKQRKHRAWVEIPGSNKRFFYYIKIGESVPPTLSVISWCEFSGFEDDKETAIFEGDVCQGSYICPACYDTEPHILTGEVVYDNDRGMWMFDYGHGAMPMYSFYENGNTFRIIGNVYENPHLLEVNHEP